MCSKVIARAGEGSPEMDNSSVDKRRSPDVKGVTESPLRSTEFVISLEVFEVRE